MSEQDLFRLAAQQHGFFRAEQALNAGLNRDELHWAVKIGRIVNVRYGLYRFAHFPLASLDELYEIQTLAPQGTFSHDTALQLYDLSEVSPRTLHFSIPPESGFKAWPGVTIHHAKLEAGERQIRDGLWVTTLSRTLSDCARIGIDPDQLLQATRKGISRGLLSPEQLNNLRRRYPYSELSHER